MYSRFLHSFIHSNNGAIIGVDMVDVFGTINAERDAAAAPEAQDEQDSSNDKGHCARLVVQLGLVLNRIR